ncbi:MAG TPA: helix-turn-helix domain-containing protein [Candidatus Norongarragalinales archaeon]|jgi:DNA-binding transcriptional ArsR family regulator|nr:helix-turn-helix domain-containing protein [Candidatus Norongarragalinales archaeon]
MHGLKGQLIVEGRSVDAEIVDEESLSVLSPDRLKILRAVSKEPKYPAEIARELNMQVQTVYYHVRLLVNSKLLQLVNYEEKGGAMAKKYATTANALGIVLSETWKPFASAAQQKAPPAYLKPFIDSGVFEGKFVVGSPDAHGRFRGRASELCAMELAMHIGNYARFDYPLYYLDTEVKEEHKKQNLVVMGGPKVNMFLEQINRELPVRFDMRSFELYSTSSGKTYGENAGVVQLVQNPFNKKKHILVLAGQHHNSTRIGVLALLRERRRFEEAFSAGKGTFAKIVQGFDEDGDGIADTVEFLE